MSDSNNNRIQVFTNDGVYLREFGNVKQDPEKLSSPEGLCVYNDTLFVVDHDNCRVCVYDSLGNLIDTFGTNENHKANFQDIVGIAVDENGMAYIADYGGRCLQKYQWKRAPH